MKSIYSFSFFVINVLLVFSLNLQAHDTQFNSLLLVLLEQGNIRVAQYPLCVENSKLQSLFTLDLSDKNNSYTALQCNQDTKRVVIIRSDNDIMCDYCLNWGAMVGVELTQHDATLQVPVSIVNDEQNKQKLIIAGMYDGKNIDIEIPLEIPAKSVVAFVVPAVLIESMSIDDNMMSFAQCCRLGIIVAKARNDILQNSSIDQEIEFENIIDAMLQDGTIKIRPVSPFMAALRTIGSTLFVKYLALKNVIVSWWSKEYGRAQQPSVTTE
jgi:hypothetical protein